MLLVILGRNTPANRQTNKQTNKQKNKTKQEEVQGHMCSALRQ